jgi:glycosyltransferase involved in cell wall biosynthesis
MKIVYWSFSTFPSQAANSVNVMKMASAFANLGHEVVVIALEGDSSIDSLELYENYGVKNNFKVIRSTYPKVKLGWILWGFLMLRIVIKEKPNLIFARDSFGALLSAFIGRNVFFEVHGAPHGRDKILFTFLFSLKRIRKIVIISKSLRDYLYGRYRIDNSKIVVAPDAVDQSWITMRENVSVFRKELGYRESDLLIGYTGSLYKGRGIELILEIAKHRPQDKFIIIGGPSNEREVFITKAKKSGLNNIRFKNYVPHNLLPQYLFSCDILLMPYQKKLKTANNGPDTSKFMSPIKMFEYMASGKPIIASNLNVIKEVLENERNSLLVESDKVSQWCNAIRKLASNPKLANRLGKHAKNDARKFTWSERVKLILNS